MRPLTKATSASLCFVFEPTIHRETGEVHQYQSMASSYNSSPRSKGNEYDFDEDDSLDLDDDSNCVTRASDEDTEDASETDMVKQEEEFTGIKEQMYQDKLAQLKRQLQQLKDSTLPEYVKKLKKLDQNYKERLRVNEIWYSYELELVDRDYVKEKKLSAKEFEEKKVELKENLILELEDKRRQVEGERTTLDLTGDSMEIKPVTTRKLRRRPNDPMPMPEKRRKPSPAQLNFILSEDEIADDLRIINKVSGKPLTKKHLQPALVPSAPSSNENLYEAKIDDGRLYYEKKWFSRGQPVFVESKDIGKCSAVITAVGTSELWLRKTSDNGKLRIYLKQLQSGKYSLRRRTS